MVKSFKTTLFITDVHVTYKMMNWGDYEIPKFPTDVHVTYKMMNWGDCEIPKFPIDVNTKLDFWNITPYIFVEGVAA